MNLYRLHRAAITFREQLREDDWTTLATGAGISALSVWAEVVLDDVVEPRAEYIAGGLTAATVALGGVALRKYRQQD